MVFRYKCRYCGKIFSRDYEVKKSFCEEYRKNTIPIKLRQTTITYGEKDGIYSFKVSKDFLEEFKYIISRGIGNDIYLEFLEIKE